MSKRPDTIDKITKARLAFSKLSSIFSIALTMFFIGALACLAYLSTRFLQSISDEFEMEVLFYSQDAGVKEADVIAYEQTLKLEKFIQTSRVSSMKDNNEEAKKAVGSNFEEVIKSPINASIILTLKPEYTQEDSLKAVIKQIKSNEMVRDVDYAHEIIEYIQHNLHRFQWIALGFCAVFMLISLILIANCIRLNIFAKRFSLRSMLLIGATPRFARRPFVFNGFTQGAWGGFIAVLLLGAALYGAYQNFSQEFFNLLSINILAGILAGTFIFSILFTTFFSFLFANRYIKVNSDRLYL